MKCFNCGEIITDGSPFCEYCGAKQPVQNIHPEMRPQQSEQPAGGQQPQQVSQSGMPQNQQHIKPQNQPQNQQQYQSGNMQYQPETNMQYHQGSQSGMLQSQQQYQSGMNQPYQQGNQMNKGSSGGGGNKNLIIAGICVGAAVVIVGIVLIVVLLMKGKNNEAKNDQTTETVSSEESGNTEITEAIQEETTEVVEETTEKATEATTAEPEPVPYAEENGLKFSGLGTECVENACSIFYDRDKYYNDEEMVVIDVPEATEENATNTFKLSVVSVTEPDSEGNVIYKIEGMSNDVRDVINKSEKSWLQANGNYPTDLFDYYSGTCIYHYGDIKGIADDSGYSKTQFKNGDKDITIYCANGFEELDSVNNSEDIDGGKKYHFENKSRTLYFIKAPQDYDGLVLAVHKGDVDYDRSVKISEAQKDKNNIYIKDDGSIKKMFDIDNLGYGYKPEDYEYFRISELANKDVKTETDFLSVKGNVTSSSFEWINNYTNKDGSPKGELITDPDRIAGDWMCYVLWDKDNALDSYGEEYSKVNLKHGKKNVRWTFDFYQAKWGKDGEWESKEEEEDQSFIGDYNKDNGSLSFSPEEAGMKLEIQGFYTDGFVQYGVGTAVAQSGETADVYLFRP